MSGSHTEHSIDHSFADLTDIETLRALTRCKREQKTMEDRTDCPGSMFSCQKNVLESMGSAKAADRPHGYSTSTI